MFVRKESVLAEKSLDFAVRIVNLCSLLQEKRREHVVSAQLVRSGTSIGANIREARSAQSKADFIAKLSIALKECDETSYWLELLHRTDKLSEAEYKSIANDNEALFAMLTATIKTSKRPSQ